MARLNFRVNWRAAAVSKPQYHSSSDERPEPVPAGSWHTALLASYNRLMGTRLGYAVCGRGLPAFLFGLILSAKSITLFGLLREGPAFGLDSFNYYAIATYQLLVMVFLLTVCLLFIVRLPSRGGLSSIADALIGFGGTFVGTPLAFAPITVPNSFVLGLAALLMILGSLLALVAILRLGRCFGVSAQARGLVTSGPYAWIRHPLYVGEEISTLGVLLPVIGPTTVLVFIAHCVLQFMRATREEVVLEGAFPRYASYKRQVSRFVPRLY